MKDVICKICNREFPTPRRLGWHLRMEHDIGFKEYYDKYVKKNPNDGKCLQCGKETSFRSLKEGYRDFCSVSCSRLYAEGHKSEETIATCKCNICNESFTALSKRDVSLKLKNHVNYVHNLTSQEYYDQYCLQEGENRCAKCGAPTRYHGILLGYEKYCEKCCYTANNLQKVLHEKETEYHERRKKIKEEKERIQNYYKRMYADDDVTDPKEKPNDVSQAMGLISKDAIRNEADKFYTEVDTCNYNLPVEVENTSFTPKRKYDNINREETPGIITWLINKLR